MMKIQTKWGANYLICKREDYKPKKEILFFGETKIIPGTKIKKIGIRNRTSFEMNEGLYIEYEGTIKLEDLKFCIFKSSGWDDKIHELLFRYAFAMADTDTPEFLLKFNKKSNACADIDCNHVTLF